MKVHIGVDADSGLVHTVIGTAANVNDVTQGYGLLHGQESVVFADTGYQGAAMSAPVRRVSERKQPQGLQILGKMRRCSVYFPSFFIV